MSGDAGGAGRGGDGATGGSTGGGDAGGAGGAAGTGGAAGSANCGHVDQPCCPGTSVCTDRDSVCVGVMGSRSAYDVARPAAPAVRGGAAAPAAASTTLKDGGVSPWAAPARLEESASSTVRARRAAVREVSAAKIACRIPAFIGAQFPVPPASASRRHSPVHANPVAPRVSLVACPRSRLFPSRLVLPRSDATPATVRAARRPDVACARRAFTRRSSRRRKRASARPRPSLDPFRGRGWRPRGRRSGGSGRLLPRVSSRFRRRLP